MRDNFILPIKGGKLKDKLFSKSVEIESYPMDYVIAPFEGIVQIVDNDKCDGYVEIKHKLPNGDYFSKICGVHRIKVNPGQSVDQNDIIGFVGDKSITYSITNNINQKIDLDKFVTMGVLSTRYKSKEKSKEEKKSENEPKLKNTSDDSSTSDFGKNLVDLALFFPLAPARLAHNALKGGKLNEEIEKIKKLL